MSSSTWWPLLWERLLIGSRQGVIFGGGGRDRVPGAGRRRRNCLGRPGLGRCGPLAGYWTGGLSVCVGCLLSLLGPGRGRLGWRSERLLRWHGLRFGPVWVGRRDFCLFFFFFLFLPLPLPLSRGFWPRMCWPGLAAFPLWGPPPGACPDGYARRPSVVGRLSVFPARPPIPLAGDGGPRLSSVPSSTRVDQLSLGALDLGDGLDFAVRRP